MIRRSDIVDADVVDASELASDGTTEYLSSVTVVSTTASTKRVVVSGLFLTRSADTPVEVGDAIVLAGNAAADSYTVASIVDETTLAVTESIVDSTGGTASFRHPSGAGRVGIGSTTAPGASPKTVQGFVDGHRKLRELIHFIEDGPAQGFTSGAFYEETSSLAPPFNTVLPTDLVWWTSSAKTQKVVEKVVTWDTVNQRPTQVLWRVYDTDGTTVLFTVTDAHDYSGTFPTRTRTIS